MAKTVKICPLGDSLTEGDGNGSAYRYALFRLLYDDGADFAFVGGQKSGDIRLPERYARHGGYCGYVIGNDECKPGSSLRAVLAESTGGDILQYEVFVNALGSDDKTMTTAAAVRLADIVLLYIGANDYGQKLDLAHVTERYEHLLDTIFTMNPAVSVYCGVDDGRTRTSRDGEPMGLGEYLLALDTAAYNEKTGRDLHVIDLDEGFCHQREGMGDVPVDDGHPRPSGNLKMALAWERAILPRVRELNAADGEVIPTIPVTGIEHDIPEHLTLRPCEGKTLHASVIPADATVTTVTWTSTYPAVASVDDYGVVTGHRAGVTKVYAMTVDGKHTAAALVHVQGRPLDLAEGMTLLYENDFSDTATLEGDTNNVIFNGKREFYAYWRDQNGHIRSRDTFAPMTENYMEFGYMTANAKCFDDDIDGIYTQVRLGTLAVRFIGGGKYIYVMEGETPLGKCTALPGFANHNSYGLRVNGKDITLYKNGERMLTVTAAHPLPDTVDVGIDWQKSSIQDRIFDIRVYGK